ncbi:MAG: HD domain-containing protein [Clostridiales Family XIII bacterium]|jgi:3'-5' exoribonuclease|nr:HD domain-containing protein [Clostridiales Family XIII bacterium]
MKNFFVNELIVGEEITDFFLVKSIQIKTGSNGKQFLDLQLGDKTGELFAKKWDIAESEVDGIGRIKIGSIIKVKATVTEWNGAKQLRIVKIRGLGPEDPIQKEDFFKAAPENADALLAYVEGAAHSISDPHYGAMALKIIEDNRERLRYYPAAAKNHHAMYAGLLYHMKRMLLLAEKLCEVYTILNRDLLITGVLFHDIEKLNEMHSDENGVVSDYTFEGIMLGHLVQGVVLVDKLGEALGVPKEKIIMLEHMVISHHYEPDFGSPKRPMFPEAEALHYLDMIDSKIFDMEAALDGAIEGGFSERIRTLDNRRVYKREW